MTLSDRLALAQWLSPAFPTGAFACSHGLEWQIAAGLRDAEGIGRWIAEVLEFGAGRQDAILLAHALRGEDVADLALALAPGAERMRETLDQGRAFAAGVSALTGRRLPEGALPVVVGLAAADLDLPAAEVIGFYLHGFAANLVSAAVRFAPLGQLEGQRLLAGLHPVIATLAARAPVLGLDDMGSAVYGADMASFLHETQEIRIFRT